MSDTPYLLHHLLERSAARLGGKEAVVDGTQSLCYEELRSVSRDWALSLLAHGLERRDRVAIFLPKSLAEVFAIFGTSMAGGVFVPINALLGPRQVAHIVRDCGARMLITTGERCDAVQPQLREVPALERVLLVDEGGEHHDARVVPRAFAAAASGLRASPSVGEDLAAILYTSGSTGYPKGVMISHRNLLAGSRIVCRYLDIQTDDRLLAVLPLSFDCGLNQIVTATEKGATAVLLTFRFADEMVHALEEHRITGLAGVPTIWALLTRVAPALKRTRLPNLRYVTNTGGPLPEPTLARLRQLLPETKIYLMFGLTEAFRSTYLPPEELDRRPTSIGRAIPETEILVITEDGRVCGPGESGTLVHHGPTVSLGYWGHPEETARVLRPHPLVPVEEGGVRVCYSGDLVRMDEEGFLYFIGRADDMIKSCGYRVSRTEVEDVLMASGQLVQAAVFGLPDPAAGQRVHAAGVPASDVDVDAAAILAHCSRELPAHMVPRRLDLLAELPLLPNGKVDYRQLEAARIDSEATA